MRIDHVELGEAFMARDQYVQFTNAVRMGIPVELTAELQCASVVYIEKQSRTPQSISIYYGDEPDEWLMGTYPDGQYYLVSNPVALDRVMSQLEKKLDWK